MARSAWNGYHSIPLPEEDRQLTTFIAEWGRYLYRVALHVASGDAYNSRYNEIISETEKEKKSVDDGMIWDDEDLEKH